MAKMNEEIYEGTMDVDTRDLIPADFEEESTGLPTGAIVALTAAATAGTIWLGRKVVKWIRKKVKEAEEAEAAEAAGKNQGNEPVTAEDFE